ncbi:fructokinase [Desulfomicrobium norvegicum]|uniref:Fructokinase n=1 Tax=Desulfomicrobium norvegicum (strain DSM 1741 / NCIMB 8310) TaxID=52561 RepID=A0A8G2C211_DESNO|nr:carbohydrate kinase [Desulfomicrobium norvegicum]SFL51221.1 fructokinase [Desulfomicrobium norvegicum]
MKLTTSPRQPAAHQDPAPEGQSPAVILFGEILADVFPDRAVLGGAPFNVARHLAAFGLRPLMISRLGDDALGTRILAGMKERGMDVSGIQIDDNLPTGQVRVHLEDAGHRFEILPRQAYDFIDPADATAAAMAAEAPGLVYFGTLSQRHHVTRQALSEMLQNIKAPQFLDINLREPWFDEDTVRFSLQSADIVKLSDEELRTLADMFKAGEGLAQAQGAELKRMFDIDRLIVTCGKYGAWQLDRDNELFIASPGKEPSRIVDTVGAGDAFSAVCILGMLSCWPETTALKRADDFASAICEIRGAVPEDSEFYQNFTKEWTR